MDKYNCGLTTVSDNKPVPLKSINIKAEIRGYTSHVTATLEYKNDSAENIEAAFTFPVDDNSAVYAFEAIIDGRRIIAEVQEKEQAKETYDDAIQSGRTATLLQESDSSGDIFHCKLGNFGPQAEAKLNISMVCELSLTSDGAVNFTLPTVLCPRYNPSVADGGLAQPDKVAYVSISQVPYSFNFDAKVQSNSRILNITSGKNEFTHEFQNEDHSAAKVTLKTTFQPDHDLGFEVQLENKHDACSFLEKGCKERSGILKNDVAMVNFFPQLPEDSYSSAQEFIIVIDRSGSMQGDRINSARDTLLLLLKSLPVGCIFNIVSFGSRFEALFPQGSKEYNEDTLKAAMDLQKSLTASFGGTEILAPLRDIYSKPVKKTHARQIFLLTDGEVYNTEEVISLVAENVSYARVFTFGIGDGVSTSLINGVAKAGRGKAEFIRDNDRLQAKVMKSMKAATQASVTSLEFTCTPDVKFSQLPQIMPPIFSGDKLVHYIMAKDELEPNKTVVKLSWKIGNKDFSTTSVLCQGAADATSDSFCFHRLAAKAQIKELEKGNSDDDKANIILMSTSANIISKHTAMVGVDKENNSKLGPMIHRDIPVPDARRSYMGVACFAAAAGPPMMCAPQMKMRSAPMIKCARKKRSSLSAPPGSVMRSSAKLSKHAGDGEIAVAACASATLMDDDSDDEDEEMDCDSSDGITRVAGKSKPLEQREYMDFVKVQQFSGSWIIDDIDGMIKIFSKAELTNSSPIKNNEVWATILVLEWLQLEYESRKDEWEMVAFKATQWLDTQYNQFGGRPLEQLKEVARALLVK